MMAATKRRVVLMPALVVAVLGLALNQIASATHPRPKSATSIKASLVPTYEECTAPNRSHGPPLDSVSCNPPVQGSSFLTVGTPDANSAGANSVGSVVLKVIPHTCCPPQDVALTATVTDVRCTPATSASVCGTANAAGGPDYSGELQGLATLRMTDHWNATSPGGGPDAATVVDIPFPITMQCVSTGSTSIGGSCSVTSSPVAVVPDGSSMPRSVVEFTQFQVLDGGDDGIVSTTPNAVFAVQGIFIP